MCWTNLVCPSDNRLQTLGEAKDGEDELFLCTAVAQEDGAFKRLLASHDEEVGRVALLCESHLLGERLNADFLGEREMRMLELFSEPKREPFGLLADMDEDETRASRGGSGKHPARGFEREHRAHSTCCLAEHVLGELVVARAPGPSARSHACLSR